MSVPRILALIFGVVFALSAIGFLFAGGGLLAAAVLRSQDGMLWTDSVKLTTSQYALVAGDLHVPSYPGDWFPRGLLEMRIEVTTGGDKPIFVGVGPAAAVSKYLDGVGRLVVADFDAAQRAKLQPTLIEGTAPVTAPADQSFWVASSGGQGTRSLSWTIQPGDWSTAILNADAASGVDVRARVGAGLPFLMPLAIGFLIAAALIAAVAAMLLVWATTDGRAETERGAVGAAAAPLQGWGGSYPVMVEGSIDPQLSRWLWLVKWLLAIPHAIILAFLWIAFWILTVVAFVAIVFTGVYPRGIFDFNVGVLRWTWRVVFYAFSPAATDQYPPFSLGPANYLARLEVAYPERLSRGLALVKWWLLAIPHYIIVGLFTNGLIWWVANPGTDTPVLRVGGGVISILVFVALVALLFTARYPRGLFDLVMGLDRWVFRVIAYATLMRDEYPPFRLDLGGTEPPAGSVAAGAVVSGGIVRPAT